MAFSKYPVTSSLQETLYVESIPKKKNTWKHNLLVCEEEGNRMKEFKGS